MTDTGIPAWARPPFCPECRAGKHPACARAALDPDTDEIVDCGCELTLHGLLR